jgi:hypothetical protein
MRGYLAELQTALCICLLCACSSSHKLAKQTAYDELVKHHAPKMEIIYLDDIPENTVLGANIAELINARQLSKTDSFTGYDIYSISDDANKRIGTIMHHHYRKYYKITVPVAKTKVGDITRIIEDPDNKMATVAYTVILEPMEPYYSKLCIDSSCSYYGEGLKKMTHKNIFFKQVGEGWKIER